MPYHVYILLCKDKTLYTGITNDIENRVLVHNTSKTGAKYTKARRPVKLVYKELLGSKGDALKRECAIKKLTRKMKLLLIKENQN